MNFKNIKGLEFDKNVMIMGDLHGVWRKVNSLIAHHKPLIALQAGDFGWWPGFSNTTKISTGVWRRRLGADCLAPKIEAKWQQTGLKIHSGALYFCPGNHEDWVDLEAKATSLNPYPVEVMKNVFYMPRCSTLLLPDGRRVLFMGGAHSIDKAQRRLGYDWYPQETITHGDIHNLPDVKVDIVVSHTSPSWFKTELFGHSNDWRQTDSYWLEKFRDPSCLALDVVWEQYRPKLWFFGHYHVAKYGNYRDTQWFALNKETDTGWWTFLPKG
jgi:hypothetical protein